MRAPILALAATALLAAALPAQESGEDVGIPGLSATFEHPVARVYRRSIDAMRKVGYTPRVLLLNEALVTPDPAVVGGETIPTVAQLGFEDLGDSTRVDIEVVAVDVERRQRCETQECRDLALRHTLLLIGAVSAELDSMKPEPRTAADSLREAKSYGYAPDAPIRVGGGMESGVRNERAFLASLRGPGGEAVSFMRIGSCCPFVPRGGTEATARIDAYEVTYAGLAKPVVLYIDIYGTADGALVPAGFTRAPDTPAPST